MEKTKMFLNAQKRLNIFVFFLQNLIETSSISILDFLLF